LLDGEIPPPLIYGGHSSPAYILPTLCSDIGDPAAVPRPVRRRLINALPSIIISLISAGRNIHKQGNSCWFSTCIQHRLTSRRRTSPSSGPPVHVL